MKNKLLIALTTMLAVIAFPAFSDDAPKKTESPEPVKLAAVVDDYEVETEGLTNAQTVALEITAAKDDLAKATKVLYGGHESIQVLASANCGFRTFTDNSFISEPKNEPYDAAGDPIDTKTLPRRKSQAAERFQHCASGLVSASERQTRQKSRISFESKFDPKNHPKQGGFFVQ